MERPGNDQPSAAPLTANVVRWFVDREQALRDFKAVLDDPESALVLTAEGPAGIGKSWLLRRLSHEANQRGIPTALLDFGGRQAYDDLLLVHRLALALGSQHFGALRRTLQEATELRVVFKVESSPGGGGITIEGDAHVAGDLAGRDIIKDNVFNLTADNPQARDIWTKNINQAFLSDLARLGSGLGEARGAVLLFDSLERATPGMWSWIEDQLLWRLGEGQLPGVRVALAGEQMLRLRPEWRRLAIELCLDPLPASEVRKYLQKRDVVASEENIVAIVDITGGRPDLLDLVVTGNPAALPDEPDLDRLLEVLVKGILQEAPPPIPETLRVAAIPEWFDAPLLAGLLGPDVDEPDRDAAVDRLLATLQAYTFVQADERGFWRFRRAVRRVLLKEWEGRPRERRELEERAARHLDERAGRAVDPRLRDELERQAVGHWLAIDERVGLERLRALFQTDLADHQLAGCELLVERAEAVESLSGLTRAWLRWTRGQLALAHNAYEPSQVLFKELLADPGVEPGSELHARVVWSMGQAAAERGEWSVAAERYEESLRYYRGQADPAAQGQIMLALGDVHLYQARAMGGLIRPQLLRGGGWRQVVEALPALVVALPFALYARAIRRWSFLPPLHHGMNYRNWTLARLLLTAVRWYRDAESVFLARGQEAWLADARQRLAQAYHRLGWWRAARDLFDRVLDSGPVVTNAYRKAQVLQESADLRLDAGSEEQAIRDLEASLQTFERYQDAQSQAQVQALLGQAYLQRGDFDRGLALLTSSLQALDAIQDRLGTGLALHALRRWAQSAAATPEQAGAIEALIAGIPDKTYLPRVPDRWAGAVELATLGGVLALAAASILRVVLAHINFLTSPESYIQWLFSARTLLGSLGQLALLVAIYVFASGLFSLALIVWGARRKLEPERLDRIATGGDAIRRDDYRGQEVNRIAWDRVRTIVSAERSLWRTPIPLLSEFRLYGDGGDIPVPATMLWYEPLKADVEGHVRESGNDPARRSLDLHILRSGLGALFLLFPLLLGLGVWIVYVPHRWSVAPALAALIGPALYYVGLAALAAGPYWWLALHPLWKGFHLAPRSRTPVVAGIVGLALVTNAFVLAYAFPYFPLRQTLDRSIHPLGFILLIVAPLWVLLARESRWGSEPGPHPNPRPLEWVPEAGGGRGGTPAWPSGARVVAGIVLFLAVALAGVFSWRVWIPDMVYLLPGIAHLNQGNVEVAGQKFDRILAANPDHVEALFYRGQARIRQERYDAAIGDYERIIGSGSAIAADYFYHALALHGAGRGVEACASLRSALEARGGALSLVEQQRQELEETYYRPWGCSPLRNLSF